MKYQELDPAAVPAVVPAADQAAIQAAIQVVILLLPLPLLPPQMDLPLPPLPLNRLLPTPISIPIPIHPLLLPPLNLILVQTVQIIQLDQVLLHLDQALLVLVLVPVLNPLQHQMVQKQKKATTNHCCQNIQSIITTITIKKEINRNHLIQSCLKNTKQ